MTVQLRHERGDEVAPINQPAIAELELFPWPLEYSVLQKIEHSRSGALHHGLFVVSQS
jgi:hypothetical protein